ncbi:hypothetical protein OHA70_14290 [Kribbella sp. NBC_00382]|uniref:hypothetical protein n=1 Tax=Kribbella sp. NBC_00382 TaxID=2975967 RepID=UPI002E237E65
MAARMGKAAVDFAAAQAAHATRDWTGICLIFVRNCFNVGPLATDAAAGYQAAKFKHGTSGTPPLGVPLWWTGAPHGHVAISTGDGNCFSSDILRPGKVDKVPISKIARSWGKTYKGWSEDINGVRIWRPGAVDTRPAVDLSNVREAAAKDMFRPAGQGLHEHDIIIVERALLKQGLKDPMNVDGFAGKDFRKAYALWQKATVPPPFDGIPGIESLKKLGDRRGFRVIS